MIATSTEYKAAIVGSPRRTEILAIVDISDPDKVMLPPTGSAQAPWGRIDQLSDYEIDSPKRYATGERGRWLGDGSFDLFPDNYKVPESMGFAGNILSGATGGFSQPQWAKLDFSGVRILQGCSLFFSSDPADGVPSNFKLEIWSGTQLVHTENVTGNAEADILARGFTVYNPTSVKLTITKWSLPSRRVRMAEFAIGLFEKWSSGDLATFSASLQGQFSCLSLPYGTVNLSMDNLDRRFEPRRKDSIFQSIEERQAIDLYIGCNTPIGMERLKIGVFYHAGDGWKTSDNSITMKWSLVDIIGLVCNRTFLVPETLPTTLGGWLKAIVSQLGPGFVNRWHADPAYENLPVTANSLEDVTGKKCGDILRWACQASGTWPRADQSTGRLTAEPLWNQGNKITLDNLNVYPTMKANESLAALIFQLAEWSETEHKTVQREYVVSGNSTTSEQTVTIINPFLHTENQALAAARLILAQYGGNLLELTGRGDPSSEIGDVDTVWLDESNATTARRMSQTFEWQNGVMRNCRSTLLQADGSYLYTEFAVIRVSGKWKSPPGVHQLRIVLGQGGQGGGFGQDGYIGFSTNNYGGIGGVESTPGKPGIDGQGGAVWYGVIGCNEEQEFDVYLGAGGAPSDTYGEPGEMGEHTTFGVYSSENGQLYPNGYTDIANGQSFARTGVEAPLPGTGDGGKGGKGGEAGAGYVLERTWTNPGGGGGVTWDLIVTKEPGKGEAGAQGATGFVMVTWEKPGE